MAKSPRTVFRAEVLDALRDGGVTAQIYDRQPAVLELPSVTIVSVEQRRQRVSTGTVEVELRATVEIVADPHARSADVADDVTDDVITAYNDATLDLSDASATLVSGEQYDEDGEWSTIVGESGEELHLNQLVLYAKVVI